MNPPETHDPRWMIGPPTLPGLYWFQVQGSGAPHSCQVLEYGGELYITGIEGGKIPVEVPYRRWCMISCVAPHGDPDWRDPRYVEDLKRREEQKVAKRRKRK